MAQFTFQVVPQNGRDLALLQRAANQHMIDMFMKHAVFVLKKDPDDVKGLTELGQIFLGRGKLEEAKKKLTKATLLDPNFSDAHYQLGLAFRLENNLPEAQREFEEVTRLDPKNYLAHGNLGFVFAKMGLADKSEAQFEAALKLNPEDELARQALEELRAKVKERQR